MQFSYTAKNKEGATTAGVIEAASREAAGQILRQQGLLPTSIAGKRAGLNFGKITPKFGRVSLLEKLTFLKNLAVTLRAGLPLAKALRVLVSQMSNAYFGKILAGIARDVESGKPLSGSMAAYPKVFSPVMVNMVTVGEQSGDLDKTLEYLSKQITRDYDLIRRTKGALMYPAVVIVALIIIGYIMFTFVLPKLTATFKEFNTELPFLTTIIIKVVDIFANYSYLILIAVGGIVAGFVFWRKTQNGKFILHKFILYIPVIGKIVKKVNLARFTIILSGLLKSSMPIVEALRVTGETLGNTHYRTAVLTSSDKVKVGVDLVASLESRPDLFTPMVTQMIQVGEETGTMDTVLEEVARFYEAEIDDTVKNLSSIIEPVLVIVIGAVVGVMAVGLILPIYNLTQSF